MSKTVVDPRFAQRERQPGLDLLRAIAIITVVFYHAGIFGFQLPGRVHRFGWVGVDLFFVLSGYLIGGQLLDRVQRGQSIGLGRFFARRALRIMPAYFAVLGMYFTLPALREFPEISPLWKFLLSIQNIGLRGGTALSHAWSLAIEDHFYLALPFVLLAVRRSSRAPLILPCLILTGGLLLRGLLAYQHPGAESGVSFRAFQLLIYYPTWTRLDPLVFGVALSAIEKFRPAVWRRITGYGGWLWLPGLVAIVFGLYLGENGLTIATCVWQFPLIALGMATLVVCAVRPRLPFDRRVAPGAALFASLAYSVYLSHKLVIHAVLQLCASHNISPNSFPAHLLVQMCIYAAGAVLFLTIERPFLQLRRRVVP